MVGLSYNYTQYHLWSPNQHRLNIKNQSEYTMNSRRQPPIWKDINLTKTVFILLIVSGYCAATIDLSNLNVNDFQFFRYQQRLPNGELKAVSPPPSSIESHFQRAKAVGTFFQRLLFGYTGDDAKPIPMVFPPTVDHLREQFKQKYGYRGEYLVEQLGNGHFRYSSGYMPCLSCKH